jgi:hypothetical protein
VRARAGLAADRAPQLTRPRPLAPWRALHPYRVMPAQPSTRDGRRMTNPVSFIAAGFVPEAAFEGRIVAELERAIAATGGAILQQGLLESEQAQALAG